MRKRTWYIDAGLIVLIILLSVFLYTLLKEYTRYIQQEETLSMESATQIPTETLEPTDEIVENYSRKLGVTAPDFSLKDLDGGEVSLSDFLGTPIMINFWTTRCSPCSEEMLLIDEYAELFEGELVVLAVNAGEQEVEVREFIGVEDFHMVFLLDPSNSVSAKYSVSGYPASMFIDKEGLLQAIRIGELDEDGLTAYLGEIGVGK